MVASSKIYTILLAQLSTVEAVRKAQAQEHTSACGPRPPIPAPPTSPTQYNGISWPEFCFEGSEPEHLFILGDWGGLENGGHVSPAPNCNWRHGRYFKKGIDDRAQQMVAQQMSIYAERSKPRLVLNGGDNFYWGGVRQHCGKSVADAISDFNDPNAPNTRQFAAVFEKMYTGNHLSTVPWLLCFGNHDYGGFQFNSAWDQQIAYTWGPTKRWILPAQYWHQHISYPSKDFSVDVYMIDTNNQDTTHPRKDPGHNICSLQHNKGANCAPFGPTSAWDCVDWFKRLWRAQVRWMEEKICASTADWQIVVTHFPPEPMAHVGGSIIPDWKRIGDKCGIDFFVGSHRHDQELHQWGQAGFPYVVAGGGGGITSERKPGDNSQYGFFDLTLSKDQLLVESINQLGHKNGQMIVKKKAPAAFSEVSSRDSIDLEEFSGLNNSMTGAANDYDSMIGTTNDAMSSYLDSDEHLEELEFEADEEEPV